MEIDLLKPKPNRIWLGMGAGGKWQKIIYERVPKLCSHCMPRQWHKKRDSESLSQRPLHNRASPKWVRPNSTQGLRFSRKRQSMKLNTHSQHNNSIEISSTDLIVDHLLHLLSIHWFINPLMMISMLVILLYSSLIAISLKQSFWYRSKRRDVRRYLFEEIRFCS